jgi:hypothetical protein
VNKVCKLIFFFNFQVSLNRGLENKVFTLTVASNELKVQLKEKEKETEQNNKLFRDREAELLSELAMKSLEIQQVK